MDGGLLAATRLDVPVDGVEADVELGIGIPAVERRPRVVEDPSVGGVTQSTAFAAFPQKAWGRRSTARMPLRRRRCSYPHRGPTPGWVRHRIGRHLLRTGLHRDERRRPVAGHVALDAFWRWVLVGSRRSRRPRGQPMRSRHLAGSARRGVAVDRDEVAAGLCGVTGVRGAAALAPHQPRTSVRRRSPGAARPGRAPAPAGR